MFFHLWLKLNFIGEVVNLLLQQPNQKIMFGYVLSPKVTMANPLVMVEFQEDKGGFN
jgi:hypothetical protein